MEKDKHDKIIEMLNDLSTRISNIEEVITQKSNTPLVESLTKEEPKQESFMEFFIKYKSTKETDKTLVIMYFLESRRNMSNITTKEISQGFREVREKQPTNISDKTQMLHKRGLIMPGDMVDRVKSWVITETGLQYLEDLKDGRA